MTFLASAAAAVFAQVGLWTGRANNAWGTSRVWSSGTSFESDSATWQSRADQAWGPSRVWSSGSSFETGLASMTSDRDTWLARANNAWGSSRTWNTGESWEAAYGRVLPPAVPQTSGTNLTATGSFTRGIWTAFGSNWTPSVSGYYALFAECVNTSASANDSIDWAQLRIKVNGTVVVTGLQGHRYSPDTPSQHAAFIESTFCSAGQPVTVEVQHSANGPGTTAAFGSARIVRSFIPTQANAH